MMPTRLLRTDTIANLADFGAIPTINDLATRQANALAFRNALASGARRISVPAGIWYFQEIMYLGNVWLPGNIEIFGEGRERTILIYSPTNDTIPAFQFISGSAPLSRGLIRDLQLIGRVTPSLGVPAVGIGIRLLNTQLNCLRDLEIWNFEVGVDFPAGFTGYTAIERFEINGCQTGIRMRDGTNGLLLSSGRILGSIFQTGTGVPPTSPPYTAEVGIGIDIEGTTGASGPGGASGVVISAVQIETAPICLRIVRSRDIAVLGCYLEPGNRSTPNTITGIRRTTEIDAESERIALVGNLQSQPTISDPADPIPSQDQTPNSVSQVPEARGVTDLDSFRRTGLTFTDRGNGGSRHGATAAHANRIRNGDMSRGALFWSTVGATLGVTEVFAAADYVIGQRSLRLTSSNVSADHIYQDVTIDAGVRSITAMVRYRALLPGAVAFRIELATVTGSPPSEVVTPLGFYSDTDAVDAGWRIRSLSSRFEGTLTGVQGPRRFRVRLYPHNVDGAGVANRQVIVDSVWLTDGEYAAPYRPYQDGIELLSGDDRVVLFTGTSVNAPVGPTGIPGSVRVPPSAIGMLTEMSISGTQASSTTTTLSVDDNTGTDDTRTIHAFISDRPTVVEYTVPLLQGGTNVQWSMGGASAGNLVTYSVRLKAWIYRL